MFLSLAQNGYNNKQADSQSAAFTWFLLFSLLSVQHVNLHMLCLRTFQEYLVTIAESECWAKSVWSSVGNSLVLMVDLFQYFENQRYKKKKLYKTLGWPEARENSVHMFPYITYGQNTCYAWYEFGHRCPARQSVIPYGSKGEGGASGFLRMLFSPLEMAADGPFSLSLDCSCLGQGTWSPRNGKHAPPHTVIFTDKNGAGGKPESPLPTHSIWSHAEWQRGF